MAVYSLWVVAVRRCSTRGGLVVASEGSRVDGEQLSLDASVRGQAQRGEQQLVRHLWREQSARIKKNGLTEKEEKSLNGYG